jgi:hypothetical protein
LKQTWFEGLFAKPTRGHNIEVLTLLLLRAPSSLDLPINNRAKETTNTLYLHWPYHPYNLQRSDIRHIYNATLKLVLDFDNKQIAISHQKNLRDILTKAALTLLDNIQISSTNTSRRLTPPLLKVIHIRNLLAHTTPKSEEKRNNQSLNKMPQKTNSKYQKEKISLIKP